MGNQGKIKAIVCLKNETRVILNILYSCKTSAMKFSSWYADGLIINLYNIQGTEKSIPLGKIVKTFSGTVNAYKMLKNP